MNRYVSFGLLVAVILVLAFLFYKVMVGFFVPLFLAALLVVIFRPMHLWYVKKCKGHEKLSALLTTASILIVVLLPILILILLAIGEGRDIYRKLNYEEIGEKIVELRDTYDIGLPASNEFRNVQHHFDQVKKATESNDATSFRTEIQVLKEDSEKLAEVLKLSWSAIMFDQEESDDLTVEERWREYVSNLDSIGIEELTDDRIGELTDEELTELLTQYQEQVDAILKDYEAFKTDFVRKQTWVWARDLVKPLGSEIVSVGGATTAFLINLVFGAAIMIIALYFFLLDGPAMIQSLKGLSPLDDDHEDELVIEFDRISRAVVVATLLSAVVQGFLAAIGFYFAGVESVFLLMLITTVLALIPFVGAAAVWAPVAIWLFFVDERQVAGVLLALYGMSVVSMADNIIKPLVLHGQSNIHPLWALLSVLGGVAALGPMGILVGPMIVAFLQTMLKILQQEMKQMEEEETGTEEKPKKSRSRKRKG